MYIYQCGIDALKNYFLLQHIQPRVRLKQTRHSYTYHNTDILPLSSRNIKVFSVIPLSIIIHERD